MKAAGWGWSARDLMRWTVLALWLGHGVWVVLGRGTGTALRRSLDLFTGPSQWVSMRWEGWKVARARRISDLAQAQSEIERLRWELEALRVQQAREAPERSEAREATRLLGLKPMVGLDLRAARIVVNNRKAPFSGMVIEPALGPSLLPDQGVIAAEGVVGRIWSASPQQASVLPLDAYNASTGVMLARSRATGVLQGTGPGRAEIRYISSQEVVQVGEAVFTSGLDRVFPRGLLVGHVVQVWTRGSELGVEVGLAAPLDRLHLVFVLPAEPPLEIEPPGQGSAKPDPARSGKR
ncbi:MAG: rod shape-determining protein MreC [Acidobacteria bacterium]|nr:rod shape-determining protein MreC [Acidobacteriota bacterium]